MNGELEQMFNQLMSNQVPSVWKNVSYLSLKPLGSWVQDLGDRLMFWNQWTTLPEIASYFISAFYFP
jgi:dynein heavy chain